MLKHLSADELVAVAKGGASLEVNGAQFTTNDLVGIAGALIEGAYLKVDGSASFNATDMFQIARARPGQVIFA